MKEYTIHGITDSHTDCECCGKAELKSTVVLKDSEGNFGFFGKVCASKLLKISSKEVLVSAKASLKALKQLARNEVASAPISLEYEAFLKATEGQGWKARSEKLSFFNPKIAALTQEVKAKYKLESLY
jgi:hypothetical protein